VLEKLRVLPEFLFRDPIPQVQPRFPQDSALPFAEELGWGDVQGARAAFGVGEDVQRQVAAEFTDFVVDTESPAQVCSGRFSSNKLRLEL
jgi:hypothetical protein